MIDAGLFREDGQIWGAHLQFGPVSMRWFRPAAREGMPVSVWMCALHLRDSDSWLWCRILGLEINIPRRE